MLPLSLVLLDEHGQELGRKLLPFRLAEGTRESGADGALF